MRVATFVRVGERRINNMLRLFLGLCILALAMTAEAQWIKQSVNTTASFRGLSVVNEKIVWASGTGGTVIKTIDGGKTWTVMTVPGAEKLDFRDIEAFDANTAYILSIGNGDASRIYKTTDGGKTWELQFTNKDEKAFYDAIACWDRNNCIAMSDPVNEFYQLIVTKDGGKNWTFTGPDKMPRAKAGEAAFAASGTCLIVNGKTDVFLATGGSDARVFRSNDRGLSWFVADTPITRGSPGGGIFSVAFRNELHGTAVGGNYEKPTEATYNLAFTRDGGKTWYSGEGLSGYRSAVAYIDSTTIIAVGTNGTDISRDRGAKWKKIGDENLNSVASKGPRAVWAVGPAGAVYRLSS
ncbi:MAG TPA: glycosyl hydrolase [Blastocatellia bacterium]|nr:glycosyl hydrolase [Blastocatellia bacterium]